MEIVQTPMINVSSYSSYCPEQLILCIFPWHSMTSCSQEKIQQNTRALAEIYFHLQRVSLIHKVIHNIIRHSSGCWLDTVSISSGGPLSIV